MRDALVITVQPLSNGADPAVYPRRPAGWLDLLSAGVHGAEQEVELLVGKGSAAPDVEKGDPVVILCGGMIRCRVACAGISNGVYGFSVLVHGADVVKAARITVRREILCTRWEDSFKTRPAAVLGFAGARPVWWTPADEQPFPDWAGAGLPAEVAEIARGLVRSFAAVKAEVKPEARAGLGIASGEPKASLVPPGVSRSTEPAPPDAKRPRAPRAAPKAASPPPTPAPARAPDPPAATPATPPLTQRSLF